MSENSLDEIGSDSNIEREEEYEEERSSELYQTRHIEDEEEYSEEDYEEVRSIKKKRNVSDSEEDMEPTKKRKQIPGLVQGGQASKDHLKIEEKKSLDLRNLEVNNLLKIVDEYREINTVVKSKEEQLKIQKSDYNLKLLDSNAILKSLENELESTQEEIAYQKKYSEKLKEELLAIKARNQNDQALLNENKKELFQAQKEISTLRAKIMELELAKGNLETELFSIKLENSTIISQEQTLKDQISELERQLKDSQKTNNIKDRLMLNSGYVDFINRFNTKTKDVIDESPVMSAISLSENNIFEIIQLALTRIKSLNSHLTKVQQMDLEKKFKISEFSRQKLEIEFDILESNLKELTKKLTDLEISNNDLKEKLDQSTKNSLKEIENGKELALLKDELSTKNQIILELTNLNQALEEELNSKSEKRIKENLIDLTPEDEKSQIIRLYATLKKDWLDIRKENTFMREFISGLQKKDENHEQIEPLDSKVFKEFNDLRTKLKKLEEDYANLTNAAKAKLERITNITRDLLGWEIKETEEFIELKNVLTSDKNNVVVFKRQENAYHIVDTKENQATFIKVAKEIIELFNNTYPVFFSVVNIEMKPEYKELVKKCIE